MINKENSNTTCNLINTSIPILYNYSTLYYCSKPMLPLVELVKQEYREVNGDRSSRKAAPAIECMVSHIIRAYKLGYSGMYVSRNRDFYNKLIINGQKANCKVGYKSTINLLNALEKQDYIEYSKGYVIRETGEMERGTIMFTKELTDLIEDNVDLTQVNPKAEENVLIIRDKNANPIEFVMTDDLEKQKITIDNYNNMMLSHSIVYGDISVSCDLKRVFSNTSVQEGGRLYTSGKNYQQLSPTERAKILIDGEATAEVDIVSSHYSMLCCNEGINLGEGEDPYYRFDLQVFAELDELSLFESSEQIKPDYNPVRNIAKDCFMYCINSRDETQAKRAMQQAIVKDRNKPFEKRRYNGIINININELFSHAEEVFEDIDDVFYTGIGVKLQKIEGDIFLQVMEKCVEQDIPVLIIHDSARAKEQDIMKVGRFIKEAWNNLFKDTANLQLKYEG